MLEVVEYIVNVLTNDSIIQGFVGTRIFPSGVDITPEVKENFPMITFFEVSEITRTVPLGVRESIYQIDIWSISSLLETDQIAERILTILNFTHFNTGFGTRVMRWARQDAGLDMIEGDRRMWHKVLRFRSWVQLQ